MVMPSARQATAVMYSDGDVNVPNRVGPRKMYVPAMNCMNPGIQMPQIPDARSTRSSRLG